MILTAEDELELATLRKAVECRVQGEDTDPETKARADRVRAKMHERIAELTGPERVL